VNKSPYNGNLSIYYFFNYRSNKKNTVSHNNSFK